MSVYARKKLNKIVAETDSPMLGPQNTASQNHPFHVHMVHDKVTHVKGLSKDEVYRQVLDNVNALYRLW